jgi:hypothetical protein
MTNVGLAERRSDDSFLTYPYCPRHCYLIPMKPSQRQDQLKSITNFVLSELGEQGKVLEIKPALSDELKKYDIETREADDTWTVKYQPAKGRYIICYVVWLDREAEFCLYHRKGR